MTWLHWQDWLALAPAVVIVLAFCLSRWLGGRGRAMTWFKPHWAIALPSRANIRLLRWRNVPGAHVSDLWRVIRIGPWLVLLARYTPGVLEDED